jgi:Na+/melibiose symporter-like transporter
MSAPPEPATPPAAPGQGRLPLRTKCTWALGSLGDNYAGNTMNSLKDPVYTVALGVPPELIGWALSVPRLLDALVDPVVGLLSDRWRGRWGRRRPFIAAGAIPLGLAMMLLWNPPSGGRWSHEALAGYFLGCTLLFYCAYSLFLVPYRALGLELTSDYHERTRLQAWGMIVGLVGGLGLPWLYKLALILGGSDGSATGATPAVIIAGAQWVGFGVGALIIATCLAPALFVRERPLARPSGRLRGTRAFLTTLRNRAFLHMLGMNFCAIVGMYAPVTATLILNIYFLFDGNQDAAATLTGYAGMAQLIGSLAGVPVNTWLSVRFGKRTTALPAARGTVLVCPLRLCDRVGHAGRVVDVGHDERRCLRQRRTRHRRTPRGALWRRLRARTETRPRLRRAARRLCRQSLRLRRRDGAGRARARTPPALRRRDSANRGWRRRVLLFLLSPLACPPAHCAGEVARAFTMIFFSL